MKYGLTDSQFKQIIDFIAEHEEVETAVLFGSRAMDTYKEASDVDIAIKGENVTAKLAADIQFAIEEDSDLPFFLDIIAYNTIDNEALKQQIDSKGVEIYRRGWRECELSEIAEVQTGPFGSQLKNEQYITGGTPVVTVEHINNFRIIDFNYPSVTSEDKERLSRYLLNEGDIIFTRVGSVDLSAYVKKHQNGWMFSSRMLRVRPYNEINSKFLSYFFQQKSFRDYILNISVGATMPSINTEILKSIPISYPPLHEQQAIAAVLSSLDDKIDLLHRQNQTLEAMAETLFKQWFVIEAQEDWEEGTLDRLVQFNYGKTLRDQERSGYGFPVYGSSGVVGYHNQYLVEAPGIITGRKGTLGVVSYSFEKFFPIDTTFYITSINKSDGLFFEYFLLKTLNLGDMNSDSAVPGLNRNLAHGIQLVIPPTQLIEKFNQQIMPLFKKLNVNLKQIQTLENLRDTLLPKLMNGEVRVKL